LGKGWDGVFSKDYLARKTFEIPSRVYATPKMPFEKIKE